MQFTNKKLKEEDIYKAAGDLAVFHEHKRLLTEEYRDINRVPSPQALYRLIKPFAGQQTGRAIKRSQRDVIREQIETVYDGPAGKVLIPKTEAASCYLGQGTRWCTAATKTRNQFEAYNKKGPLLVVIPASPKHTGEKYQFHFHSGEVHNEEDEWYDFVSPLNDDPETIWRHVLRWVDDLPEQTKIESVKNRPYSIKYIPTPSLDVQLTAVKQGGVAIEFIKNPIRSSAACGCRE